MTAIPFAPLQGMIQERNLIEILNGTKRRFSLIVAFVVLGGLLGLGITFLMPRKYEAQLLIALDTGSQSFGAVANNLPGTTILQPPVESIVLSQVEILQSRDLAENVMKDLGLDEDPMFWSGSAKPADQKTARQKALLKLVDNLQVKPIGRSLVIDIRYRHNNAVMSANIANRFGELYQEQQVREKVETAKRNAIELQARLQILSKKLRESAKAVDEYSAKEDLVDGAKAEITSQQISDLSTQLIAAQADEASARSRQSQMQDVLKNRKSADSTTEVIQSHMVELLKNDEAALLSQLADLQSRYGPNHPKILAVQSELSEVRRKQQNEIGHVTQNVDNEVTAIQAKVSLLKTKLQELEDKRKRENHAAIGLMELQREADANRTLYETFLNKYKENNMLGDLQQPDTRIISAARIPVKRSGPHPILIIMIVSFAGFVTGILLSLILEEMETTVRTPEELKNLTNLEVLSVIPEEEVPDNLVADYTLESPFSPLTESLRNLCIRLVSRIEKTPCTIAVTSCLPDRIVARLTIWTGKLIARTGLRVLVLDADLRKPEIAEYFGIDPQYPVTDILFEKRIISQSTFPDKNMPNFLVMAGSATHGQEITALSKDVLKRFFDRLKGMFDIILVNTAPFRIAETKLFHQSTDYTVFTVQLNLVPLKLVSSVYRQSVEDGNNILGFVATHYEEDLCHN